MTPLLPPPLSLHIAVTTCPFSLSSSSILGTHVDEKCEEVIPKLVGLPHLMKTQVLERKKLYEVLTEDNLPFQTERCVRQQCWPLHMWD